MLLSASLHRSWYAPGDVVRVEVSLHVPPNPPGSMPNSLAMLFGRANNDFTETDTDAPPVIHVKSLMACVVGVCVVDSKRLQYAFEGDKQMTEHFQMLVGDNLSKGHNAYRLFCSEEFSLVSHLPLREKESRALVVSFTLPGYLPPSFRGQCIQFYYALHLHGTRCGPRESTARVKLRVPIKVFSAQAVVTPLLLPLSFPLDKFDFGERVLMRQSVPSPALTGPLESYLVPSEVEDFHANSLSRISLHRLMSQLSRQRTPLEFPLSLNGELALTVAVASTTVMIGDSLNGIFAVNSNLKSYPVKVHGNLEFLECCSSKHVKKETSCHQLPGWGKELVVAQTMVKEEFEWAIIDRASVHFFIPFTNPNTYASMHTDVVTTFWQLRLRFLWCKPSVLRQCRERRSGELMLEEEPELVIPLTVVPPAHCKEKSCKGSMVQVLC